VTWEWRRPLSPAARVFGGGESFQGPDLRGRTRVLRNAETHGIAGHDLAYLNVPFFWSDDGWGVLALTGAVVRADVGATDSEAFVLSSDTEPRALHVFEGSPAQILAQYHRATGLPGAFPAWALGVWTSRCSYLSEAEIGEVLDGYAAADCPVDVVHVDAWVSGNVIADLACNWTVDRTRFPAGWVERLNARGVQVSLWVNPYVVKGSARAAELERFGLLVRDAGGGLAVTPDKPDRLLVDFTDPAAVAWWQARVREVQEAEGNAAYKLDFGEELPETAVLHDGRTGAEARNDYALLYQQATAAAVWLDTAFFCRSGNAGAQRFPCHWVGDTPSTWAGLTSALRACLSLSLSGFAFVSHDIGGFWTGGSHDWVAEAFKVMDNADVPADVDPELFARWAQWGALSPVMRFHGTGRREPWAYPGEWGEAAVEACRLRRRLQPGLVEAAAQAASDGTPVMRPMALAYPAFPEAGAELQYLLGDDVLVAPLLQPGGRRRLWVPPGTWAPLCGLAAVDGPGWVEVECGPFDFPAWQRA